uniref:Uncharacterized protein n=1 Tax=Anguilla anguilla TaxID=7936 RepID=A0A0E9WUH4_ANGAN
MKSRKLPTKANTVPGIPINICNYQGNTYKIVEMLKYNHSYRFLIFVCFKLWF